VVVIVLTLVSITMTFAIVMAVVVTGQRETRRSHLARQNTEYVVSSINFATLFPGDARIETRLKDSYLNVLRSVLVTDYLDSPEIRAAVDTALPPARQRGAPPIRPIPNG
jgi:hypothetical protein